MATHFLSGTARSDLLFTKPDTHSHLLTPETCSKHPIPTFFPNRCNETPSGQNCFVTWFLLCLFVVFFQSILSSVSHCFLLLRLKKLNDFSAVQ